MVDQNLDFCKHGKMGVLELETDEESYGSKML